MICPSCGYSDESQFCKHCGAPMVTGKKADFLGTPKFTGVTIPPATATEGFKAEDIEGIGNEEGMMEEGMEGESIGNSFGIMMVVVIVVALILFAIKMSGNVF